MLHTLCYIQYVTECMLDITISLLLILFPGIDEIVNDSHYNK